MAGATRGQQYQGGSAPGKGPGGGHGRIENGTGHLAGLGAIGQNGKDRWKAFGREADRMRSTLIRFGHGEDVDLDHHPRIGELGQRNAGGGRAGIGKE